MLEVRALTKRYGGLLAVDKISFTVNRGEVVGYLGPNGSGLRRVETPLAFDDELPSDVQRFRLSDD